MKNLQIFRNEEFGEVRTILIDCESLFVLKDTCSILEFESPHKVAERLEEDERNQIPIIDSIGRNHQTTVINESDLFNVIIRSDKLNARKFRKWVTSEVLPSIRKHGIDFFSKLINPHNKDILNLNRVRRLRYLFATILKTLIFAFMFSIMIRSFEIRRFSDFSSAVSVPFLGFFFGVSLFLCNLKIP